MSGSSGGLPNGSSSSNPRISVNVVARRPTGERVMISEHVDLPVAKKVVSLMQCVGNYVDIFMEVAEVDGTRLSYHCDG